MLLEYVIFPINDNKIDEVLINLLKSQYVNMSIQYTAIFEAAEMTIFHLNFQIKNCFDLFDLMLYVPGKQLWPWRDGQLLNQTSWASLPEAIYQY